MASARDYLILTNNALVNACMGASFQVRFLADFSHRDILIAARDLVYAGHTLYAHPLSGSIKPNRTPYKSVAVSRAPRAFSPEEAEIIAEAILAFDKFAKVAREDDENVKADLRLIDYTLLAGALDFDAAAGFSRIHKQI